MAILRNPATVLSHCGHSLRHPDETVGFNRLYLNGDVLTRRAETLTAPRQQTRPEKNMRLIGEVVCRAPAMVRMNSEIARIRSLHALFDTDCRESSEGQLEAVLHSLT